MSLSGLAQFIIGFLLGVFVLTGTGAAAAYFFLNQLSDAPPQPVYSEEDSEDNSEEDSPAQETSSTEPKPEPKPEPEPEPKTIEDRFGEQAYEASVNWPSGLSLRSNPSNSASRVGGVYYGDKLVIIGRSSDGDWQKVYVPETGQQAWVKAGNVEKVN